MAKYIMNGILYSGSLDENDKPRTRGQTRIREAEANDYKIYKVISRKKKKDDDTSLVDTFFRGAKALGKRIMGGNKKGSIADRTGRNKGGMIRKRIGHTDFRKGGMVVNTVDNRKNK